MTFMLKNKHLFIASTILVALISIGVLFYYVSETEKRSAEVSNSLVHQLEIVSQKMTLLGDLSAEVGYGGFIHNFKNYVLRRDPIYKEDAIKNYSAISEDISLLQKLMKTQAERDALNDIQKTVTAYYKRLYVLQPILNQGGINQDDIKVRVDDSVAVTALEFLYSVVRQNSESALIEAKKKQAQSVEFIRYGYILIFAISVVAGLLIVLMNRLQDAHARERRASQAKSQFLSTMSHEIRTPLNGVIGLVQLLNLKTFSKEERYHLDMIRSSGELLLGILNDILDINKIEADKMEIEDIPTDMIALLATTVDFYKNVASERGLDLEYENKLQNCSYLTCDPTKMRQVLSNILSNAIKFTEDGSIKLTALGDLSAMEGDRPIYNLVIQIKDTGIGMNTDQLELLFEKYTQADTSISRKYGGTGLGMALSKQLTELMGGKLTAESAVGKGTLFTIHLPLPVSNLNEIRNKHPGGKNLKDINNLNVLVAEDNMVNAVVAKGFLENLGMKVRIAHDGNEAVRMFEENQPDLILMDVNMPDKSGIEATLEVRAKPNGKTVPILALTADAFAETHQKCMDAGMNGVLSKPFSYEALRNKIYDTVH